MKHFKLTLSIVAAMLLVMGCAAFSNKEGKELRSLRNSDVLDESSVEHKEIEFISNAAGSGVVFERSFENAPPMIPHDLEGMLPVTLDSNACITCHMPDVAEAMAATPIPKSHFYSIRFQKDLGDKLSDERYVCTTCHAHQANLAPRVKNNFAPEFRQENGQSRSNLLDVLNDGVK